MNTLKTIQTVSKIGRIVCTILFICCVVGFCLYAAGAIELALGQPMLQIGGVTIRGVLQGNEEVPAGDAILQIAAGMIFCACEAVVAKFGELYSKRELASGTPFTKAGAKELLRLGILAFGAAVAGSILSGIAYGIVLLFHPGAVFPANGNHFGLLPVGVLLIFLSLLCRLGAENAEQGQERETGES